MHMISSRGYARIASECRLGWRRYEGRGMSAKLFVAGDSSEIEVWGRTVHSHCKMSYFPSENHCFQLHGRTIVPHIATCPVLKIHTSERNTFGGLSGSWLFCEARLYASLFTALHFPTKIITIAATSHPRTVPWSRISLGRNRTFSNRTMRPLYGEMYRNQGYIENLYLVGRLRRLDS